VGHARLLVLPQHHLPRRRRHRHVEGGPSLAQAPGDPLVTSTMKEFADLVAGAPTKNTEGGALLPAGEEEVADDEVLTVHDCVRLSVPQPQEGRGGRGGRWWRTPSRPSCSAPGARVCTPRGTCLSGSACSATCRTERSPGGTLRAGKSGCFHARPGVGWERVSTRFPLTVSARARAARGIVVAGARR